jgi:hypothetical protein
VKCPESLAWGPVLFTGLAQHVFSRPRADHSSSHHGTGAPDCRRSRRWPECNRCVVRTIGSRSVPTTRTINPIRTAGCAIKSSRSGASAKCLDGGRQAEPPKLVDTSSKALQPRIYRRQSGRCCANSLHGVRGIDTPSLQAQGEQRRSFFFKFSETFPACPSADPIDQILQPQCRRDRQDAACLDPCSTLVQRRQNTCP